LTTCQEIPEISDKTEKGAALDSLLLLFRLLFPLAACFFRLLLQHHVENHDQLPASSFFFFHSSNILHQIGLFSNLSTVFSFLNL